MKVAHKAALTVGRSIPARQRSLAGNVASHLLCGVVLDRGLAVLRATLGR